MSGPRTPKPWCVRRGLRTRSLIALVPLVACAKVFGIDGGQPLDEAGVTTNGGTHVGAARGGRSSAGRTAAGGRAAAGGRTVAAGGGTAGEGAALGNSAAGDGSMPPGESGAGPASAAGAPANAGGTGAGAAGDGGAAGDAGAAGTTAPLGAGLGTLGAGCENESAYACSDASTNVLMQCNNGVWQFSTECDEGNYGRRCNPASPGCYQLDAHCLELAYGGPVCDGNEVLDCSQGLYTERHLVCPFGCAEGECVEGTAGELTLHTGIMKPQGGHWSGEVPVCLVPPPGDASDARAHFEWVRSEVESVWNRYLGVVFTGFGDCADDATGVVVSFPVGCEGHLVNDVSIGAPLAARAIPLEICLSYTVPGADEPVSADEALTRLLARHQFGHVLGLTDGDDPRATVMVRGVELARVDRIVPTISDYAALELPADPPSRFTFEYLGKHALSLVTPQGDCIGTSDLSAGAMLGATSCFSPTPQTWSPPLARLEASDSPPEYCAAQAVAGEPVLLSTCAPGGSASEFHQPTVKWRTPTACVAADASPPSAGTGVVTSPCTAMDDPLEAWSFEILEPSTDGASFLTRIHLAGTELCLSIDDVPAEGARTLALDTCSAGLTTDDPQVFTLGRTSPWGGARGTIGTIEASIGCFVDWQSADGNLDCEDVGPQSAWFLSGPVVNDDGLVLTLLDDGTVAAVALPAAPSGLPFFDFYF